jgi:hypothetical protein
VSVAAGFTPAAGSPDIAAAAGFMPAAGFTPAAGRAHSADVFSTHTARVKGERVGTEFGMRKIPSECSFGVAGAHPYIYAPLKTGSRAGR